MKTDPAIALSDDIAGFIDNLLQMLVHHSSQKSRLIRI
jgi:hypothetical protein